MSDVWNGVWTPELLSDLCDGVTREAGSFKARRYRLERRALVFAGPLEVRRTERTTYIIAGDTYVFAEFAVDRLNELFAVPLNEDGSEWKVRRPDPQELAANCPECKGTREVECGECGGDGDCECSCGHEHDCHECGGDGVVACEACLPAAA